MYSAASLANAFLSQAFGERKGISPMKIQKLAYLAHGYHLVEYDEPLLDEVFEAWRFGPVLNSLYHQCKHTGKRGITRYLDDVDPESERKVPAPVPNDPKVLEIVDFVWNTYGKMPAPDLSCWTHERGGPWDKVTNGGSRIIRHQDVPNDLIKSYFERRMNAA